MSKIIVHILNCGTTTIDEALPFSNRSKNPLAFTGIGRDSKHKMTAVKVGGDRYVVIAGDAGYGHESWEKLVLPGITWNKNEALASLERLQQYGQDENCLAVLMTHDTQNQEVYEL